MAFFLRFLISNKVSGSVTSWVKIFEKWTKDVHVNLEAQLPDSVVTRRPCMLEPSSSIESLWCWVHGVHLFLCEKNNSRFTFLQLFAVYVVPHMCNRILVIKWKVCQRAQHSLFMVNEIFLWKPLLLQDTGDLQSRVCMQLPPSKLLQQSGFAV